MSDLSVPGQMENVIGKLKMEILCESRWSTHSSLLCNAKHAFRTYINVKHLSLQQLSRRMVHLSNGFYVSTNHAGLERACTERIKIKCISRGDCSYHIFSRLKSSDAFWWPLQCCIRKIVRARFAPLQNGVRSLPTSRKIYRNSKFICILSCVSFRYSFGMVQR